MLTFLIVLGAALIVFVLYRTLQSNRKTEVEAVPQYVCSHCGEKDCDCHTHPDPVS